MIRCIDDLTRLALDMELGDFCTLIHDMRAFWSKSMANIVFYSARY